MVGALVFVGFSLAALVLYGLLLALSVDLTDYIRPSQAFNFLLGGITVSLIAKFFESFIKTEKIDLREDKFQDPHEFEQEFRKLIAALKNRPRKVVITFDNLDRVSGDSALSIISTIKTFLDFKGLKDCPSSVIFLIPCDVDSMKRHIRQSLKTKEGVEDNHYIDEFLRKFFNTSIWIPDFYWTDLERFATSKLLETEIPEFNNSYLAWLIIKVFNKNPRQIIQFVNHLVSNYLLLEEICLQKGLADIEFHKKNVAPLAKYLLIKQRHPECLEKYREAQVFALDNEALLAQIKDEDFKILLKQTEDIQIPSLEPYFKGRMTREEQDFPGIVKLLDLMKYNVDEHTEYARTLELGDHVQAFDSILKGEFNRIGNVIGKVTFLNHLLDVTDILTIRLSPGFYRDIINFLLGADHAEVYFNLNPKRIGAEIFEKANQIATLPDQQKVINNYLDIVCDAAKKNTQNLTEGKAVAFDLIFEFFVDNKSRFSSSQAERLKLYFAQNGEEFDLRKHFFKDEETQKFFIDQLLIDHYFEAFSLEDTYQTFYRRLDLLHHVHPRLSYTKKVLDVFKQYWEKIFIYDLGEAKYDFSVAYIDILRERIEMATVSGEPVEMELVEKILRHIRGRDEKAMIPWIVLLHRLLGQEAAAARVAVLLVDLFREGNEEVISQILSFFPVPQSLLELSDQLAESYIDYLAKKPYDKEYFHEIPEAYILLAIEKQINWRDFAAAEALVLDFRDQFDPEIRQRLFELLKTVVEQSIEGREHIETIDQLLGLMVLLTDLNEQGMEESGFWDTVSLLLHGNSSEAQSMLAKRLIKDHLRLLSKTRAEALFDNMIKVMDSHGIYNNEQFHETLNLLRSKVNQEYQEVYLDRLIRHVIRFTTSFSVTLLAAEALEKIKFNVKDHFAAVIDFERYINASMSVSDRERIRPVIKVLAKLLKGKQNDEIGSVGRRLEQVAQESPDQT